MQAVTDERMLASAVRYLIEGNEMEAVQVLLAAEVEAFERDEDAVLNVAWLPGTQTISLHFVGPRFVHEVMSDEDSDTYRAIVSAFEAVLPADATLGTVTSRAEIVEVGPNWREEMRDAGSGAVHNQAADAREVRIWNGLRFLSESEVRIAQALDRAGVWFLPNCKGRLGLSDRFNRAADFLVCVEGKWGILEVDGEPFHPPARTVHDHQRDRLFKSHGIRVAEHFDATECYEQPDDVVARFLAIVHQAG